jgi:hypothetical protein
LHMASSDYGSSIKPNNRSLIVPNLVLPPAYDGSFTSSSSSPQLASLRSISSGYVTPNYLSPSIDASHTQSTFSSIDLFSPSKSMSPNHSPSVNLFSFDIPQPNAVLTTGKNKCTIRYGVE